MLITIHSLSKSPRCHLALNKANRRVFSLILKKLIPQIKLVYHLERINLFTKLTKYKRKGAYVARKDKLPFHSDIELVFGKNEVVLGSLTRINVTTSLLHKCDCYICSPLISLPFAKGHSRLFVN